MNRKATKITALALLALILSVMTPVFATPANAGTESSATAQTLSVNLNKASSEELQKVPGIGPALAKRIIEFRKENGPFSRVQDLLKVRGIGEKSLKKLAPYLTVKG